jgi:hypothetical protein
MADLVRLPLAVPLWGDGLPCSIRATDVPARLGIPATWDGARASRSVVPAIPVGVLGNRTVGPAVRVRAPRALGLLR